ncbi:helix-turn-helix transcriptional regulator [Paenibacillus soyae]|uniref:AraC family transcriptional regulator n=1 Tax=Paenibacillus soyae TaxID=2969249 RepID=A0A9X2S911_9BACL|nr:AraC family transcriptional regulator [Paenibacillus soyae]MCR2804651.1 AraC family transcriptional regulator [Paenibacillus soyae]
MHIHRIVPKPSYPLYVCYPDMFGRYAEFPLHEERRESGALQEYNLHLVFGGSGYAVGHGGERVELKAGEGFLYAKEAFQQYGSSRSEPWDVRWIHFTGALPSGILRAADEAGAWLFSFSGMTRIRELTDRMYELSDPFGLESEAAISALLYELLVHLDQDTESLTGAATLRKRNEIREAADTIRGRCQEPWDIARMAELTGYSPYHFLRLFRDVMGRTPNRYLTECRLLEAKLLLATTGLAVKDVAERIGFSQASYFIRVFRGAEGLSPSAYRELHGRHGHS